MKTRIHFNEEANEYLSKQSSEMKALIDLTGEIETFHIDDPFIALISQIIYQSISTKAGDTIWNRFKQKIKPLTPEGILDYSFDEIKEVGLSRPKTNYIMNVASAFLHKEINLDFKNQTDEEIIKEVTKIKGIGEWTAQMLLIFCLDRPNVLPMKDFGITKGLMWLYDLDEKPTKEVYKHYQKLFSPYNTTASHYLWEIYAKTAQNKQ